MHRIGEECHFDQIAAHEYVDRLGKGWALHRQKYALTLDSYPEIFKQGDFNIDIGAVRRLPTTRQFVGWLCRRGGMRFRAGSVGGVLGLARGGSGCWRVVRTDVCGKIETAARPGHLGETVGVAGFVTLDQSVPLELAQIIAECIEAVRLFGEMEGGEDGLVDLLRGPAAEVTAGMQDTSHRRMTRRSWILMPG